MHYLQNKQLSRRTALKGLGATLSLPLLEAMGPFQSLAAAAGPETNRMPVRSAFLFFPNGVNAPAWLPEGAGRDWKLSPTLEPLGRHKSELLVLTELWHQATNTGDGHYVKVAGWLTGTTIHKTTGSDLDSGGTSVDQVVARRIGNLTPLPSLELGIEPITSGVDANVGYTRLYGSHISWSTPTTPLPKEINPQLAFDRLFRSRAGVGGGNPTRDLSVLDLVSEDARRLRQQLGQADRAKLDEYLESVRAVEKRIEFETRRRQNDLREDPKVRREVEALGQRIQAWSDPARASERNGDHTEHVRLMMELMALAFWTDSTRVSSFMFGNAVSGRNFSFLDGVNGGHHQISHHERKTEKLEEYQKINRWHVEQFAWFLDRLRSLKEGEGTLLDNCMVQFGSGFRDGNSHNPHNLPLILAGRGGGTIATDRHLVYGKDSPLSNLYVSMLKRMGTPVERFADSTGELAGLDSPDFAGTAV